MFGEWDREAEFSFDSNGGNSSFNVESFDRFYFGIHPIPPGGQTFSFSLYFTGNQKQEEPSSSDKVNIADRVKTILDEATGQAVAVIPEVLDGEPWIQTYMGKEYQVASIRHQNEIIPLSVFVIPGPIPKTEEFLLTVETTSVIPAKLIGRNLIEPDRFTFVSIINGYPPHSFAN